MKYRLFLYLIILMIPSIALSGDWKERIIALKGRTTTSPVFLDPGANGRLSLLLSEITPSNA